MNADLECSAVLAASPDRGDVRDGGSQVGILLQNDAGSFHDFELSVFALFEFFDPEIDGAAGHITLSFSGVPRVLADDRETMDDSRQAGQPLFDFRQDLIGTLQRISIGSNVGHLKLALIVARDQVHAHLFGNGLG